MKTEIVLIALFTASTAFSDVSVTMRPASAKEKAAAKAGIVIDTTKKKKPLATTLPAKKPSATAKATKKTKPKPAIDTNEAIIASLEKKSAALESRVAELEKKLTDLYASIFPPESPEDLPNEEIEEPLESGPEVVKNDTPKAP